MKSRSWINISLPFVVFFTLGALMVHGRDNGYVDWFFSNGVVGSRIYPHLRAFSGWMTDLKFQARGPRRPSNKIIIVGIDSQAIKQYGRWPWHRDVLGHVLDTLVSQGVKVVGVDILAPEKDLRVAPPIRQVLKEHRLDSVANRFETDPAYIEAVRRNADHVVLAGMLNEGRCRPSFTPSGCLTHDAAITAAMKEGFSRFTISNLSKSPGFSFADTPLFISRAPILNFPELQSAAQHMGDVDFDIDSDGVMRRTVLFKFTNELPFPSFALEIARLAMGDEVQIDLGADSKLKSLGFVKSQRTLPVSPLGQMEINFRGDSVFPTVSVVDIMSNSTRLPVDVNWTTGMPFDCKTCKQGPISGRSRIGILVDRKELLQDAVVLLGMTAPKYDETALPFKTNSPGIIGHAHAIDNLMAGDALIPESGNSWTLLLLVLTVGALFFGFAIESLSSTPAILVSVLTLGIFAFIDTQVLFAHNHDWHTGFVYLEYFSIAVLILINKYVVEEGRRKFLRRAFSRFVSPEVVTSIIKDPKKLELGGTKKDLTILFSDIRGFMPLCKKLDSHALLAFLRDYHQMVTRIIIQKGTLDKYVGDNVMAFWGAPLDQKNHAYNSCMAAVKMVEALNDRNHDYAKKYGIKLGIGIGINTGPVTVGNIGSEQAISYTAIGDDVNLASRVERLTRYYGINILATRATFDSIQQSGERLPPHRVLDRVKVIGAEKAVEVIHILDQPYPTSSLEAFQAAREFYAQRRWDEAIENFQFAQDQIRATHAADDTPSKVLIRQCQTFKASPPPADWDGSWEMLSK